MSLEPICRKCVNLIDCPFDCDPWARKHRYDERRWCTVAKEAVGGNGRSYEVPISHITQASRIEAKRMNWGHPLVEANIPTINKIIVLLIERHAFKAKKDICDTLSIGERHYYQLLQSRKEQELKNMVRATKD